MVIKKVVSESSTIQYLSITFIVSPLTDSTFFTYIFLSFAANSLHLGANGNFKAGGGGAVMAGGRRQVAVTVSYVNKPVITPFITTCSTAYLRASSVYTRLRNCRSSTSMISSAIIMKREWNEKVEGENKETKQTKIFMKRATEPEC